MTGRGILEAVAWADLIAVNAGKALRFIAVGAWMVAAVRVARWIFQKIRGEGDEE